MITKNNIIPILLSDPFNFEAKGGVYSKKFGEENNIFEISYDSNTGIFNYPSGLTADRNTTEDYHQNESFVVFLCVAQLFSIGYKPHHFKLEGVNYSGTNLGYCDILVKDNNEDEYLIIECKTSDLAEKDDQFRKHWQKTLNDGGQLFRYFNTYRKAKFLCMYSSDYVKYKDEDGKVKYRFENIYNIISLEDNPEQLNINSDFDSFQRLRQEQGTSDDFFKVWKKTYKQDFTNRGLIESGIEPFKVGNKKYDINDLHIIDNYSLGKKYNDFATILRKHTVSSHENAFDKLINLFIAKIIDETDHREELGLIWKGAAYDDYYSLQDRLNILYKEGMRRFFNDNITFVDTKEIENAFTFLSGKADEGKRTIHKLFRELKYYSNNPFAFIDVHNEVLFYQNAAILRDVILMLQDIYLTANEENQFLGDLFEGFLNKGVHQSEGQFFTPLPIVRFLISSLPLDEIISKGGIPQVIDYACGAGHFLTEYARQIKPFVLMPYRKEIDGINDYEERNANISHILHKYYNGITGIEKDYRLSKVSQVAAYMYNMGGMKILFADALSNINTINNNFYDILIANPPYSVSGFLDTLKEEERECFELSKYVANPLKNNAIQVFFIERAAQLLKDEGLAAIILPVSILTNGNIYMYSRELLLRKFDIVSICSFGKKTFGQTSTNTITLFLRKKKISPDYSCHINNRINAWFSGDMSLDEYYEDVDCLDRYCQRCGFELDDYISMLRGEITESFLNTDMGEEYYSFLNLHKKKKNQDSTGLAEKAKSIRDEGQKFVGTQKYLNLKLEEKEAIDKQYLTTFIKEIEKEKLFYYMLTSSNPQQVLIIESPTAVTAERNFLGYEISTRKGNEGIKYNTLTKTTDSENGDEEDDDTIAQLKGINNIQTPLFNPYDLYDDEKINSLIRKNYKGEFFDIPDSLSDYVKQYSLEDLLNYGNVTFDKKINLSPPLEYPQFETSFDVEKLKKIAPYVKEKAKITYSDSKKFVSTINMLENRGGIKEYEGDINIDKGTLYKKGDILVSNIRPYLKKIWLSNRDGICSNDVFVLRNERQDIIKNDYLFQLLSTNLFFNYMMVGKTGLKMPRGDKKSISNFRIPLADKDVQNNIIKKCTEFDKNYLFYYNRLKAANDKIRKLFAMKLSNNTITYRSDKLINLLVDIKGHKTKIKKRDIQNVGAYPVITQERGKLISGYTDNNEAVTDHPLIIFGDHSCSIKYIDFDFVRGADGTQMLKANEDLIINKYLYGYLLSIDIPNSGKYERHYKYLKDIEIKYPTDLKDQIDIVKDLEMIEKEIQESEEKMVSINKEKEDYIIGQLKK